MTRSQTEDAAQALERLSMGHPQRDGNRSASLPDPEVDIGPPRADPPEHWRASTGRQDITNRRRQVLNTIISPVVPRPGMTRGSSTLSVTSTSSALSGQRSAGTRTPVDRSVSGVTFPSPPDSNYVVASASFPSPQTASTLAQPHPIIKPRNKNKKGLAGVMTFLRTLKGSSSSGSRRPPPLRINPTAPSPYLLGSPPVSPSTPFTPSSETNSYPTSRSSFSAMAPSLTSPPLKRVPSPQKQGKRPSIRNMFRSTSGNWSDLVKSGSTPTTDSVPPLPGRRSIESGSEREDIPGMPRRGILRQSSSQLVRPSKTPTNASFNLPNKGWKSPKRKSKIPDQYNYADQEQGVLSKNMSRQYGSSANDGEVDRTVRPTRKSRILGLGMPNSPSTSSFPRSAPGPPSQQISSGTRSVSNTSGTSAASGFSDSSNATGFTGLSSSSSAMRGSSGLTMESASGVEMEKGRTLQIAPEHLPALLEYLVQCEEQLGEWKARAQGIFGEI